MAQKHSPSDSSDASSLLGVDLGSNHIRIGATDQIGKVLTFRRIPYSQEATHDANALAFQLRSATKELFDELALSTPVSAIGIAFPGMVAQSKQRIVSLSHLPLLDDINIHGEFSDAFDVPVHFEQNANAAAFAEMNAGIARGIKDWLYLHIGANVSAGLVLGGELQRGKSGLAGAIGQMRIDPERNGDSVELESMASAENIVRRTQDRLHRDKTSSLSRLGAMGGFTYDDIIEAAHSGDDLAKMMIQRTGGFIAMAISDVISLLNPEMVVVGGAPAGRAFLAPAIAEEAKQRVSPQALNDCRIVPADLGPEATVIGAALLAKESAAEPGRK